MNTYRKQADKLLLFLGLLLAVVFILSVFIGRYPEPFWMPLSVLLEQSLAQKLVFSLRLPRLIMAMLLGMSLSACGETLQMIFRNPIVEPGFLGVSQGAAFGAAVGILFLGGGGVTIKLSAAACALLGLSFSFLLARYLRFGGWVLRLVLSGIVVSALLSAGLGVMKYLADPLTELQEITFWLLGGLWSVTWRDVLFVLPVVVIGLLTAHLLRWRLNVLSLNEETAFSLGSRVTKERALLLIFLVAAVAMITSVSGIVNWVGLIVPHLARRIVGPNAQFSMPASMLMGGIFVILCDNIARTLLAGEIPLGIITSFLGALIFVVLMTSRKLRFKK